MCKRIGHQCEFILAEAGLGRLSMMPAKLVLCTLLSFATAAWGLSEVSMPGTHDAHDDHPAQGDAHSTLYPATVVIDPRKVTAIVIKINARLVGQHDLYIGKYVSKGEVLAEIESAELETLQRSYIATVSNLAAVNAFSVTSSAKIADGKLNLIWRGMSKDDVRQIDLSREPLKQVKIRAPVSGFISTIEVINNQIVNGSTQSGRSSAAGKLFASISDPGSFLLEASVPATKAAQLKIGQSAMVLIPGKDEKSEELQARVIQIYGFVNPVTQRRLVRLRLEGRHADLAFANGLLVAVRIPLKVHEEKHED